MPASPRRTPYAPPRAAPRAPRSSATCSVSSSRSRPARAAASDPTGRESRDLVDPPSSGAQVASVGSSARRRRLPPLPRGPGARLRAIQRPDRLGSIGFALSLAIAVAGGVPLWRWDRPHAGPRGGRAVLDVGRHRRAGAARTGNLATAVGTYTVAGGAAAEFGSIVLLGLLFASPGGSVAGEIVQLVVGSVALVVLGLLIVAILWLASRALRWESARAVGRRLDETSSQLGPSARPRASMAVVAAVRVRGRPRHVRRGDLRRHAPSRHLRDLFGRPGRDGLRRSLPVFFIRRLRPDCRHRPCRRLRRTSAAARPTATRLPAGLYGGTVVGGDGPRGCCRRRTLS